MNWNWNIPGFPKLLMKWNEPKEFCKERNKVIRSFTPFWLKPLGVIIVTLFMLLTWWLAKNQGKNSVSLITACLLGGGLGLFLVYIVPWICRYIPSEVKVFKDKLVTLTGGYPTQRNFEDIKHLEITRVKSEDKIYPALIISYFSGWSSFLGISQEQIPELIEVLSGLNVKLLTDSKRKTMLPLDEIISKKGAKTSKPERKGKSRRKYVLTAIIILALAALYSKHLSKPLLTDSFVSSQIKLPTGEATHMSFSLWGNDSVIETGNSKAIKSLVKLLHSGMSVEPHKCMYRGIVTLTFPSGKVKLELLPGHTSGYYEVRLNGMPYRIDRGKFIAALVACGVPQQEIPLD